MRNPRVEDIDHPELDDRLREPLDEEERILMDPDTWDWDNVVEVTTSPEPRLIFEVRLSHDEITRIEPAAIAKGMTITAFLKHAALRAARLRTPR